MIRYAHPVSPHSSTIGQEPGASSVELTACSSHFTPGFWLSLAPTLRNTEGIRSLLKGASLRRLPRVAASRARSALVDVPAVPSRVSGSGSTVQAHRTFLELR